MKLTHFIFYIFPAFLFPTLLFAQANEIPVLSRINYDSIRDVNLNDVWGYVDQEGNEYALVGTTKGISIVDLSNPTGPKEIYWHPGSESTWRDLKVFGNYAYITSEGGGGLQIIDLSPLPHEIISSTASYFGLDTFFWNTAHNLWIDEIKGSCFIFGANRGNGGVIILDIKDNPMQPKEVGHFDEWYVHDGYVRNDTMYLAHIFEGFFSIIDISDYQNPTLLTTQETPLNFTHNIWPTDDGNYVYVTDERNSGNVTCYDISNLNAIQEIERIQSTPNEEVMPHNVHVMGDYIITSFYTDGVIIHNISDPNNIFEVGRYKTYKGPEASGSFGCWGAYPYLPSGILLASDMQYGLYILQPDYTVLSTPKTSIQTMFSIYPNPVKNQLTIEGVQPGSEIILADLTGKIALNSHAKNSTEVIDTRNLPNGVYTLFVDNNRYKIIKH